jgi:hypothetical protein
LTGPPPCLPDFDTIDENVIVKHTTILPYRVKLCN